MTARCAIAFVLALVMSLAPACSSSSTVEEPAAPTGSFSAATSDESDSSSAATPATTTTSSMAPTSTTDEPAPTSVDFRTGAEVLADRRFDILRGQRVGLIVNQTSLVDGRRLIDVVAEQDDIELVRLFAPEHGIDGSLAAGVSLADSIDDTTGVPIASLYGDTRQPTIEMFADLDVVVFDLQDVGSRSYTYISTMGLAMQTAAATQTAFVVLDRPNPAGGERIGGAILDPSLSSFIGMYPLPNVHGLTVGEIATLIVEQAWLDGLDGLDLTVVPMQGWTRDQMWSDLERDWVAPSPRLPTADSALLYGGTVLLAGTSISDGSGTPTPFELVGAPFIESGDELAALLDARSLPGIRFEAVTFTPEAIPGVSPKPLHQGVELDGVRLVVTDVHAVDPVRVAIEVLVAMQALASPGSSIIIDPASFDLVAGTTDLRQWIERGDTADDILTRLQPALDDFERLRSSALLYD
ncbi:MAG: DUF1343 domain-containing protein [Acidimicrobiales bacterium]